MSSLVMLSGRNSVPGRFQDGSAGQRCFFPPSFWLLVLWWTGSLFHCMLCFSFIFRQCSTHSVHLCHYTPNDSSERWFSSPESNVQWELGLSPAVLAANVVIMHFIQVLVITSQGTGVWALFGFVLFCFSREQLQLAKLLFLYNWATVLAKRKTRSLVNFFAFLFVYLFSPVRPSPSLAVFPSSSYPWEILLTQWNSSV